LAIIELYLKCGVASFPAKSSHSSRRLCSPPVGFSLRRGCELIQSKKTFIKLKNEKLTSAAGICVFACSFLTAVELTLTPSLASLSTKLSIPDFLPDKMIVKSTRFWFRQPVYKKQARRQVFQLKIETGNWTGLFKAQI
jgi:hypothetical protein